MLLNLKEVCKSNLIFIFIINWKWSGSNSNWATCFQDFESAWGLVWKDLQGACCTACGIPSFPTRDELGPCQWKLLGYWLGFLFGDYLKYRLWCCVLSVNSTTRYSDYYYTSLTCFTTEDNLFGSAFTKWRT